MFNNEEILGPNPEVFIYRVGLSKKDSDEEITFKCVSLDFVDAIVQADKAFPGCRISMVTNLDIIFIPPTRH